MTLNLTNSSLGQAIVLYFVEKEPPTSVKANYSILGLKVSTPVIFAVLSIYFFNLFFYSLPGLPRPSLPQHIPSVYESLSLRVIKLEKRLQYNSLALKAMCSEMGEG